MVALIWLPLGPEAGDAQFHDVAETQPDRRGVAHADAGWGAGVDQVIGFQDHEPAQVVDGEGVGDHRLGVAVLAVDPVGLEPQPDRVDDRDLPRPRDQRPEPATGRWRCAGARPG